MTRPILALLSTFIAGAFLGNVALPSISGNFAGGRFAAHSVVMAQSSTALSSTRLMMTRLYNGSDNQAHAEEMEVKFSDGAGDISKMPQLIGAELHRASPGKVSDWHPGPSHRYVITLSGRGELEVAGGKRISVGPGHIELIEDTTGKGHITRAVGTEDRVTLHLLLADQSVSSSAKSSGKSSEK
jgi:hypothetical protein